MEQRVESTPLIPKTRGVRLPTPSPPQADVPLSATKVTLTAKGERCRHL